MKGRQDCGALPFKMVIRGNVRMKKLLFTLLFLTLGTAWGGAATPKSNSPMASDDAFRVISGANSIHIVDTQSTENPAEHAIHALPVNMKRGDAWQENAIELQQGIRNFTILVYEMTVEGVSSISDAHNRLLNRSRESLSKTQVDVIEERNIWWVEANRIFIRLYNPTSKDISGVIFSLAKSCGSVDERGKLFLSFDLGASSLKATQYAMYSSNLPFNFSNSFGSGTLCGIVEMASG